ncbi:hypothetical protein DFJ67_1925 [Asanoa ferruginea]|uniref:Uncharacterized protein n=1 Tax=Asanoa ferruginea TaxID=53367 RepID=A0A3D9ZF85_9ACTN|nr:hypothetical protein [Asanoa ferruginea]REF95961.1 hypothetical protein DFJ67_1925 [Asanoa ferruginea]GIF52466.1 hypothetical protein Afe04nite_70050 [Asanoa ferruginea]
MLKRRSFRAGLSTTLAFALLWPITGCDAAMNAPAAQPPQIRETAKLVSWPSDPNYYSDGHSFELVVDHALLNELTVYEDGLPVARFDGENPDNGNRTTYVPTDLSHDEQASITRTRYIIAPKVDPAIQAHLRKVTYRLQERSINPAHKGTADEQRSTDLTVVNIRRKPDIRIFTVPRSVQVGSSADVAWRVLDCKKVELYESGGIVHEETAPGQAETIEGSKSIVVTQHTKFSLRAYNALRDVSQIESELLVTSPPPCPENADGQPRLFTFCVKCPGGSLGDYASEWTQMSCSLSSAQDLVQRLNNNCTVTLGPCRR